MRTCVDAFLDAVEQGTVGALADVFAEDAVLDATVPHWRFCVRGGVDVRGQLSGWFANPGHFAELRRTPLEGGELVEFDLRWMEDGVLNAAHQAHHLDVEDDRITRVAVWCGGRWPASLLAEMEAAAS